MNIFSFHVIIHQIFLRKQAFNEERPQIESPSFILKFVDYPPMIINGKVILKPGNFQFKKEELFDREQQFKQAKMKQEKVTGKYIPLLNEQSKKITIGQEQREQERKRKQLLEEIERKKLARVEQQAKLKLKKLQPEYAIPEEDEEDDSKLKVFERYKSPTEDLTEEEKQKLEQERLRKEEEELLKINYKAGFGKGKTVFLKNLQSQMKEYLTDFALVIEFRDLDNENIVIGKTLTSLKAFSDDISTINEKDLEFFRRNTFKLVDPRDKKIVIGWYDMSISIQQRSFDYLNNYKKKKNLIPDNPHQPILKNKSHIIQEEPIENDSNIQDTNYQPPQHFKNLSFKEDTNKSKKTSFEQTPKNIKKPLNQNFTQVNNEQQEQIQKQDKQNQNQINIVDEQQQNNINNSQNNEIQDIKQDQNQSYDTQNKNIQNKQKNHPENDSYMLEESLAQQSISQSQSNSKKFPNFQNHIINKQNQSIEESYKDDFEESSIQNTQNKQQESYRLKNYSVSVDESYADDFEMSNQSKQTPKGNNFNFQSPKASNFYQDTLNKNKQNHNLQESIDEYSHDFEEENSFLKSKKLDQRSYEKQKYTGKKSAVDMSEDMYSEDFESQHNNSKLQSSTSRFHKKSEHIQDQSDIYSEDFDEELKQAGESSSYQPFGQMQKRLQEQEQQKQQELEQQNFQRNPVKRVSANLTRQN